MSGPALCNPVEGAIRLVFANDAQSELAAPSIRRARALGQATIHRCRVPDPVRRSRVP